MTREPPLLLSLAIEPHTKADLERLGVGLGILMADDSTFAVKTTDDLTGEVVIEGTGEAQLEVIVDRLKREFSVEASVGSLRVAYKETVTRPADGEMKYARQTGGRGQYGHAKIHLYPGEPGSGYVFENEISGGAVPKEFIRPIDEGIKEALTCGVLAGYPVDDVRVVLYEGSYHDVDSSEMSFKIAGSMAFQDAAKKAKPVLLEPVMRVRVLVPEEHLAGVLEDLGHRRARFVSHTEDGAVRVVTALAPLSDMLGYAASLGALARGRGIVTLAFDRYEVVSQANEPGDGGVSFVTAPLKPTPKGRRAREAVAEPEDDTLER
jgi:elongation factor G